MMLDVNDYPLLAIFRSSQVALAQRWEASHDLLTGRGGVMANASWRDALRINLHSRLTQRVLVQLPHWRRHPAAGLCAGTILSWRHSVVSALHQSKKLDYF